jgi:hypothetical protein
MEFTLTYRGKLKSNGSVAEKHAIRGHIHRQLKTLWQRPQLSALPHVLEDSPPSGNISLISHVGPFRFAPLVSSKIFLVAELSITFLRPQPPGALIKHGGDIDNRMKTLLDALRKPHHESELPPSAVPAADEDPYFCLFEDDMLVTGLAIRTDQLLEPVANQAEVLLLVHVHTKITKGIWLTLGLG